MGYDKAIALWERSKDLDNTFPTVLRNLSIALFNKRGDKERAKECMERAFELDKKDARVFLELDQLYARLGKEPSQRLKIFEENIGLIEERDDLYTEYVTLLNLCGQYNKAHKAITGHNFQTWEGAEGKITTQFKICLFMMAKAAFEKNDPKGAIALLEEALSYPENLGEGRLEGTKDNNLYYLLGLCYRALGDGDRAKENFEKSTLGESEPAGMMYYYDQPADMILFQGLGFSELDDTNSANTRFYKLLDYGEHHVHDKFVMDYFAVSMPDMSVFDADMDMKNKVHCYYLMGLGNLGLGKKDEAKTWFSKALDLDKNHQLAALYRNMCK